MIGFERRSDKLIKTVVFRARHCETLIDSMPNDIPYQLALLDSGCAFDRA